MTEDNIKLAKQLGDGFRHFVYWNKYKMIPNEKEELKDGVRNINFKTLNFMAPFYGRGSTASRLEPLRENCSILVFDELKNYSFLFMMIALMMMILIQIAELKPTLLKSIFFQE